MLAFAQGRSEWGPRALGQRSILAKATHREMRERINRRIKHREDFRPFSPAVLDDEYSTYFEKDVDKMSPWMTAVVNVSPSQKSELGAAVHEDGSARAQSVNEDGAPDLAKVLTELMRQGHSPIALSTSLNGPGEPIAARVEDLFSFFLKYKPDALLIGDLLVERK
ncbi:MAG: hypothetical protein GY822_17915 [Deltaproteobacteria bacterium]|nr:hypothetical protein [Deltaproteobacteria bacterium]